MLSFNHKFEVLLSPSNLAEIQSLNTVFLVVEMMKTLQYFPGLFGIILAEMLAGDNQGYMICFYSHPRTPTLVAYTFQFLQAQSLVSDSSALSDSYFYLSFISRTPWNCLQKRRWMNADLTSSSPPSMKIIFPSDSASLGPSIVPSKFLCVCFFYFGGFYGGGWCYFWVDNCYQQRNRLL